MATLNYSTSIPAARTIGEIQRMLAVHGAAAVTVGYVDGKATGVSFALQTPHGERVFTLPVDVAALRHLLREQARAGKLKASMPRGGWDSPEHAERVAWRVVKDWLEAQLAIIEARMATLDQVMLPYLHVEGGTTLYELYRRNEQRAIET
jgi:hypothetical protein